MGYTFENSVSSCIQPRVAPSRKQGLRHRVMALTLGSPHVGDLHDRAARLGLPLPAGSNRRERIHRIRELKTLFIHVPKNAGTSIATLLYGRSECHNSIRYYERAAPDLFTDGITRFAIWRDPVERFLSAYDFARHGGGRNVALHAHFQKVYSQFRSVSDAIDHLASVSDPYRLDHVFRPQSWYLLDKSGKCGVDYLFPLRSVGRVPDLIPALRNRSVPRLNVSNRETHTLSPTEATRIRTFYKDDEALRRYLLPI